MTEKVRQPIKDSLLSFSSPEANSDCAWERCSRCGFSCKPLVSTEWCHLSRVYLCISFPGRTEATKPPWLVRFDASNTFAHLYSHHLCTTSSHTHWPGQQSPFNRISLPRKGKGASSSMKNETAKSLYSHHGLGLRCNSAGDTGGSERGEAQCVSEET